MRNTQGPNGHFVAWQFFSISDRVSFPVQYDSLFKMYPYSCVFSFTTVKQRNDTLWNDMCLKWENIVTEPNRSLSYVRYGFPSSDQRVSSPREYDCLFHPCSCLVWCDTERNLNGDTVGFSWTGVLQYRGYSTVAERYWILFSSSVKCCF